jgi:SpoVK/Ycf46/Vps4 family AAA+-type ATPase
VRHFNTFKNEHSLIYLFYSKSSSVFEKYIGESEKTVTAIFSLARKLAPTVIFIDEIDTILSNRNTSSTQNAYSSTLGLFLSEWDGLTSDPGEAPVVVLGATNRPQDIDDAFKRRMPVSIETKPPNLNGRIEILEKMLTQETMDVSVLLDEVAIQCEGFTGSDLRELCRLTQTVRAKEMIGSFKDFQRGGGNKRYSTSPRALHMNDFEIALSKMKKAGMTYCILYILYVTQR